MTLITAVIGGLACGYILGLHRRAFLVGLAVWAVVFAVQTLFVVDSDNRGDWSYLPVQAAILGIAAVMIWLGAGVRAWLSGRLAQS